MTRTWFEGFQRQSSLSGCLGTIVLNHGESHKTHFFKVNRELKVLTPHGVEGVAVNGFGTKVAAVNGHAQNIHLDAGAAGAVTWTNILTGQNLRGKR